MMATCRENVEENLPRNIPKMKYTERSNTERIGVAAVDKLFQQLGYIFREQPISDTGIDAHIEIVHNHIATGKLIAAQIKSGMSWFNEMTETGAVFRGDDDHLNYWTSHSLPVIVILYNPEDDVAYWEIVSDEKVSKTPKGWKIEIPFVQKIDLLAKPLIERIVGDSIPKDSYTILSIRDTSHGGAKRYSANVLVENTSKSAILSVAKKATKDAQQRMYYRNEMTKQRWGNAPANVVFLFIYISVDDLRLTNWICRSLWIDKKLPEQFAPIRFSGEEIGNGIIVEWSPNHQMLRNLTAQSTLSKEDYLDAVFSYLKIVSSLVNEARDLTADINARKISSGNYIERMIILESKVTECYMSSGNMGLAPLECRDVSQRFNSAMSFAHNVLLPFSERGLSTWQEPNRSYLVRRALEDFAKEITRLEFELEKVQ